jgi:hypothetical protein
MGKIAPDGMIDAALDYVALSDYMCICSGSPSDYTTARSTNILAGFPCTSGCFAKADGDSSGRKLTVSARTAGSITASGSALAIALVKISDTTLRYVTTCTEQYLVASGTVDTPAFKITIADPT